MRADGSAEGLHTDGAVLDRDPATIAREHGARHRRALVRADVDISLHSSGMPEYGAGRVLDLDPMHDRIAEPGDGLRHATEPCIAVQDVRRLVDQHTAALAFPGTSPRPGSVVGVGTPEALDHFTAKDGSQLAAREEALDLLVGRLEASLEHHRQPSLASLR